jgi:ribosome maturation factor RimP
MRGPSVPTRREEGRDVDAETLVRPVVEGAGLELVDVTFGREGGRRILRLTVDRDGGVDLDAISRISEKVSRRLDLEGFEPGPYSLEVTTPGLERPLRRPPEYRRAIGERVRVRVADGAIEGDLVDADEERIRIAAAEGERVVPLADVASAKTVVDWDAELKRSER